MSTEQGIEESAGRIFDIGYQRYDGPREGRARGRRSLLLDGIRNGLGIGRGGWPKIIAWGLISIPLLTGLGFALAAALINRFTESFDGALPSHEDLYTWTAWAIFIFAAVIGPELTCADRRQRVTQILLVRPITLNDYLLMRWLALVVIMLIIALLPQFTMWLALVLTSQNLVDYLREEWLDVPRFIASGVLLSLFVTGLTFLAAAATSRRIVATLTLVGVVFVGSAIAVFLLEYLTGASSQAARLINLIELISVSVTDIVFGKYDSSPDNKAPAAVVMAWYLVVILVTTAGAWFIHHRRGE